MFDNTNGKTVLRRRIKSKWSKGEKSINNSIEEVAAMGDSTELEKAIVLLDKAQQKVADFVDRSENNENEV